MEVDNDLVKHFGLNNNKIIYTIDQKDDLMDYLKKTQSNWAKVAHPDDQMYANYDFPPKEILGYIPNYTFISKQLDRLQDVYDNNPPGLMPIRRMKFSDIPVLLSNCFWGILKDLIKNDYGSDLFTIDNRLFAIAIFLSLVWVFWFSVH